MQQHQGEQQMYRQQFNEGLEQGDLARLVDPEITIDEFKSKLGRDEDVCVLSFKIMGKEPAVDIVSFIEKGYDWIIDADTSAGELEDGHYMIFVEFERNKEIPENIMTLFNDLQNITKLELQDWTLKYHTDSTTHELTAETLASLVPLTPEAYTNKFGNKEIDKLKTAAGVAVDTKAPKNDFTESLRTLAGII